MSEADVEAVKTGGQEPKACVILFYRYAALHKDASLTEEYRKALETLCRGLRLTGRILVAPSEGINGTLAGSRDDLKAFTRALLPQETSVSEEDSVCAFRRASAAFFEKIGKEPLLMSSSDDFKWSVHNGDDSLFPDLNIKLVSELIGTGGALSKIGLEDVGEGYLTPERWHEELQKLKKETDANESDDTILIDCRNTKEYSIGHFDGALDPGTTTFAQFPRWVQQHAPVLANKRVLMYCTGGIRCEKASAFIRKEIPTVKGVQHLKGGIHKYLELYGDGGSLSNGAQEKKLHENSDSGKKGEEAPLWKGRNFVFDNRGAASALETFKGREGGAMEIAADVRSVPTQSEDIVGRCVNCSTPHDVFSPRCVCTVCREPVLTCPACQKSLKEFHCQQHQHLRGCYFWDLSQFSPEEMRCQLWELKRILQPIAVGRKYKQKRKTLIRQCEKIEARLQELGEARMTEDDSADIGTKCRSCGEVSCDGSCWGFHGLKRKERLGRAKSEEPPMLSKALRVPNTSRAKKKPRHEYFIDEVGQLGLCQPPSMFRDAQTGLRIPPPCTRVLRTSVKAKWFGQTVSAIVQKEFIELSRPEVLKQILHYGLLRVNQTKISTENVADLQLKNGDEISRIIHWHEPPVAVPERVSVEKILLPENVVRAYRKPQDDENYDGSILVCDKPASVPVHPAGPFLANSLTLMVEGQQELQAGSLNPVHRTDRATSGLTICTPSNIVARVFHQCNMENNIQKLYIAQVSGKFPASDNQMSEEWKTKAIGTVSWLPKRDYLVVHAPVHTVDPSGGMRIVDEKGKPSESRFRILHYDPEADASAVLCCPVTGRNHQLRVHLQWLGFRIVGDQIYGSARLNPPTNGHETKTAIPSMLRSIQKDAGSELKLESLTESDVESAKAACPCCQCKDSQSLLNCFSKEQLLQGGHAILLHALRYRVTINAPNSKKFKTNLEDGPLATLEFAVGFPAWLRAEDRPHVQWLN